MKLGTKGKELIMQFEGCKLKSYQDGVGVWTIGYGNTFYEDGKAVVKGEIITQNRAIELFDLITSKFVDGVNKLVKSQLTQNQFDAILSLSYNIGLGNFGKSTLLKKININPNDATIPSEFLKWNKSGGVVVNGLTRRRTAESNLYKTQ